MRLSSFSTRLRDRNEQKADDAPRRVNFRDTTER